MVDQIAGGEVRTTENRCCATIAATSHYIWEHKEKTHTCTHTHTLSILDTKTIRFVYDDNRPTN